MQGDGLIDVVATQEMVQKEFARIRLTQYEAGTCKRVFKLPNNIGLAVTHGNSLMERDLIRNEEIYLAYLKEHQYPVVDMHGGVFAVEGEGKNERYGYLMDYIPNAVFIEVKSPSLLKTQIFAALLGIPTQPSEGWWGLNFNRVNSAIAAKLDDPENYNDLKANAATLLTNFTNLIEKLERDSIAIADLQIMLGNNGSLTIIDPLDVVKLDPVNKKITSIANPDREPAAGFRQFLMKTTDWLTAAQKTCSTIANASTPALLKSFISSNDATKVSALPAHLMQNYHNSRNSAAASSSQQPVPKSPPKSPSQSSSDPQASPPRRKGT